MRAVWLLCLALMFNGALVVGFTLAVSLAAERAARWLAHRVLD